MVSEAWLTKSSLLFDRVCYEHHHHEHHHITLSSYRFGKKIIRIITIRNHQDHRKHPNSIRGKKNKIECLFVLIKKKKICSFQKQKNIVRYPIGSVDNEEIRNWKLHRNQSSNNKTIRDDKKKKNIPWAFQCWSLLLLRWNRILGSIQNIQSSILMENILAIVLLFITIIRDS